MASPCFWADGGLRGELDIVGGPSVARGIFGAGSGFRAGCRAAGRVNSCFFKSFLLVLTGLLFWRRKRGGGRGGVIFLRIPSYKSLRNSRDVYTMFASNNCAWFHFW